MTTLPAVPDGHSPYEVYLGVITQEFWGAPTPGLNVRIWVLVSLTIWTSLMALVYVMLTCEQALRRNGGPGVWVCKWAIIGGVHEPTTPPTALPSNTNGSRIIVVNTKLALAGGMMIQQWYCLAYLLDFRNVYVHHAAQSHIFAFRAFLPFPICFVAWGLSFGMLQAYTLVHTNKLRQRIWGPRLNYFFIYGGIVWLSAYLIEGIIATVAGYKWSRNTLNFSAQLQHLQVGYTGVLNAEEWLALDDGYGQYIHKRKAYGICSQILYGSLPFFIAIIVVINSSTFMLTQMISERVDHHLEDLTSNCSPLTWEAHGIDLTPLDRCATRQGLAQFRSPTNLHDTSLFSLKESPGEDRKSSILGASSYITLGHDLPRRKLSQTWRNQLAESSVRLEQVRALAERHHEAPVSTPEEAKRLRAIQVLELDATRSFLALVGGAIALCAFFCLAVALDAAIVFRGPFFTNWIHFEIAALSFPWAVSAMILIAGTPLLYIQFRARSLWIARKESSLMICRNIQVVVEG